jgi:hypothetical protein
VFVDAGRAVGAPAITEFDFAEVEMLLEFGPFGFGQVAVFLAGPQGVNAGRKLTPLVPVEY